jgi:hypothetical protein
VALVAVLGLFLLLLSYVPLWHTDVWGHLTFGRWIVQHGRLPDNALFPFTEPSPPGLHAYWLCQSGLYLTYRTGELAAGGDAGRQAEGGVQMVRALHTCVLAARFVILLLAMRRLGKSMAVAGLGLLLVLVLGSGHIAILRPQAFAELFFACVLFALSRDVLSRRALLALPILLAVWANCHGSYTLGLALIACWLVGRTIGVAFSRRTLRPATLFADLQIRRLLMALLLSIAAVALLNPHGPYIFLNTYEMAQNPNVARMDEWQPIDFRQMEPAGWIFLISLTVLIVTQVVSKKLYAPGQVLLMLLFGVQAVLHQRMLVWWLMLVPWLAAPLWATVADRLWPRWQLPTNPASFRKTILAGIIVAVLLLWSAPGQWLVSGSPVPLDHSVSKATPWQLAEQLRRPADSNYLPALTGTLAAYGPEKRFFGGIFASETLGDYLLWSLPEDLPVFVSSHVHLYSAEHWQQCAVVKWGALGWEKVLADNGVNLIVVEGERHPHLRDQVLQNAAWQVVLDEAGSPDKPDPRTRLFVAVRKKPI